MAKTRDRREDEALVLTVNEAAFVAGVTVKQANQAIDREKVHTRVLQRKTDRASRGLGVPEVVYLRVSPVLAPEVRPKLYRSFRGRSLPAMPREFEEGSVRMDLSSAIEEVRERLDQLSHIHARIETHPEVRGGEPLFKGTRTPVYMIARKLELGSTRDELLEDYPHLEEGDLQVAARFAELYPRQGRPRTAWAGSLKRRKSSDG
jgi:uncharacterized protein (DUF433 family)